MTKIKKALLSIVCCFAVIFCCAFVFTACTKTQNIKYEISIVQLQNGTVTCSGEPYAGNEISIKVVPHEGYELVPNSLLVNGKEIKNNKFLMPNKNVSITAEFRKITYSISKSNCEHGSFTVPEFANYQDVINLELAPDVGYELDQILVDGKAISGNSFTMPAKDVVVSVSFRAIDYSITVNPSENGSIVPDKTTANVGDLITLTVNPNATYKLRDLIIKNGDSLVARQVKGNTVTFTMPAGNVTISATFAQNVNAVNINPTENGNVSATPVNALEGAEVVLTVSPTTGYKLKSLKVMFGETEISVVDNKFTMPAGEVTVIATFEIIDYTISKEETANGSFEVSKTTANYNDEITITVAPATGYELDQILVDEEEITGTTFTMPAKDVTVKVTFKAINFTITREGTSEAHGTYEIQDEAKYGEEVTITENTEEGYEAVFTVMCNGTPVTVTNNKFIMPAGNVTISVSYTLASYTILANEECVGGSVSVVDPTSATMGETITVTVAPEDGYSVDSVYAIYKDDNDEEKRITANPTGVENEYSFIMPAGDVKIFAAFVEPKAITIVSSANGRVTADKETAFAGEKITLTITPNEGCKLLSIEVSDGTTIEVTKVSETEYTFVMKKEEVTITPTFEKITYTITNNSPTNGSFEVKETATYGETVTITVTPATGYELDQILVDGDAISGNSFTMPANNVAVSVTFKAINYAITKNITGNGVVNVKETATYGENVTISVTPATGYELNQILVDGVALEVGVTSFTMPANNVAVSVTFKAINYTITVNPAENGSFTVSKATANYNDEITITVTPSANYVVREVKINGSSTGVTKVSDTVYTFTMPANSVQVEVVFYYVLTASDIEYTSSGTNLTITKVTTDKTRYEIPSTFNIGGTTYDVTAIGDGSQNIDSDVVALILPNTITRIANGAFKNCAGLISITIPEGVETIGNNAFSYSGLTSVAIPSSVTSIGNSAFINCRKLTSVTIAEGVGNIGSEVFSYCTNLTSITIPSSVTNITRAAFKGCASLTSITIPEGVTSIADSAFENCTGLTSITIPNSITTISKYAFRGTYLYSNANDGDLIYVSCADGKKWILGYKGTKPTGPLEIPSDVFGIAEYAFSDCTGLTLITVPNSVIKINSWAFSGCTGLTSIIFSSATLPTLGLSSFPNSSSLEKVYVPTGSKAAYTRALGSGFASKIYENLISAPRSFDGREYVNLGRDYMYQDTLTVEVRAYMDDWSKYTTNMRLISCTEGGGWNVGEVLGGKIHFSCYDSGNGYKNVTTSMTFADLSAGWHTFKITFDGNYFRAYIDGELVGTSEKYVSGKIGYHSSNAIFVAAEASSSATTPNFSSGNFKGKIAYVRIENNVS